MNDELQGRWWSTNTDAAALTEADLRRVVEQVQERHVAQTARETSAYIRFLSAVPEQFRSHPEILTMASIVAASQTDPIHPKDRDRLMARYKEIVNGVSDSSSIREPKGAQ